MKQGQGVHGDVNQKKLKADPTGGTDQGKNHLQGQIEHQVVNALDNFEHPTKRGSVLEPEKTGTRSIQLAE